MTTITVRTPTQVAEPRGAQAAVAAILALRDAWARLRAGLVQYRAHRSRLAEAAKVRALADQMAGHDPRVAAEMYAAADRHERG